MMTQNKGEEEIKRKLTKMSCGVAVEVLHIVNDNEILNEVLSMW